MHTDSTVELITARIAAVGARANTSDSMSIAANVLAYSMIRIEEGRSERTMHPMLPESSCRRSISCSNCMQVNVSPRAALRVLKLVGVGAGLATERVPTVLGATGDSVAAKALARSKDCVDVAAERVAGALEGAALDRSRPEAGTGTDMRSRRLMRSTIARNAWSRSGSGSPRIPTRGSLSRSVIASLIDAASGGVCVLVCLAVVADETSAVGSAVCWIRTALASSSHHGRGSKVNGRKTPSCDGLLDFASYRAASDLRKANGRHRNTVAKY